MLISLSQLFAFGIVSHHSYVFGHVVEGVCCVQFAPFGDKSQVFICLQKTFAVSLFSLRWSSVFVTFFVFVSSRSSVNLSTRPETLKYRHRTNRQCRHYFGIRIIIHMNFDRPRAYELSVRTRCSSRNLCVLFKRHFNCKYSIWGVRIYINFGLPETRWNICCQC